MIEEPLFSLAGAQDFPKQKQPAAARLSLNFSTDVPAEP